MAEPGPTANGCPRCHQPLQTAAPFCSHCGLRVHGSDPTLPPPRPWPFWLILGGLVTIVIGGATFFISCFSALSNSGGGGNPGDMGITISAILGVVGGLLIIGGTVAAIFQAFRR